MISARCVCVRQSKERCPHTQASLKARSAKVWITGQGHAPPTVRHGYCLSRGRRGGEREAEKGSQKGAESGSQREAESVNQKEAESGSR